MTHKDIWSGMTVCEVIALARINNLYEDQSKNFLFELLITLYINLDNRTINSKEFRSLIERVITFKPIHPNNEDRIRWRIEKRLKKSFPELLQNNEGMSGLYGLYYTRNLINSPSYKVQSSGLLQIIRNCIYEGNRKKSHHFWDYE